LLERDYTFAARARIQDLDQWREDSRLHRARMRKIEQTGRLAAKFMGGQASGKPRYKGTCGSKTFNYASTPPRIYRDSLVGPLRHYCPIASMTRRNGFHATQSFVFDLGECAVKLRTIGLAGRASDGEKWRGCRPPSRVGIVVFGSRLGASRRTGGKSTIVAEILRHLCPRNRDSPDFEKAVVCRQAKFFGETIQ